MLGAIKPYCVRRGQRLKPNPPALSTLMIIMKYVKILIILLIAWAFFFYYPHLSKIPTDAQHYIGGIEQNEPSRFEKPLLYWVSMPIYNLIGDWTFFVVPLVCILISIWAIMEMFDHYKVNLVYLLMLLPLLAIGMSFIFQFTRDALLFCVANLFFLSYIKNKLKLTVAFMFSAFLTKTGGALLLIPFLFKKWRD